MIAVFFICWLFVYRRFLYLSMKYYLLKVCRIRLIELLNANAITSIEYKVKKIELLAGAAVAVR